MITLQAFGRVHPAVHGLTRDLRVEWALEELALPYRVHGVDHTGGETNRDEFRRISPFKQLPLIEDDGFVLTESGAILLYLAEKAGRLADPKTRATVTRWCFAALTTIEPGRGHPDDHGPASSAPRWAPRNVPTLRGLPAALRSAPRVGPHRRCLRGAPRRGARRRHASGAADVASHDAFAAGGAVLDQAL